MGGVRFKEPRSSPDYSKSLLSSQTVSIGRRTRKDSSNGYSSEQQFRNCYTLVRVFVSFDLFR